ncbi:putative holliday junction resolvase [Bacillus phage vB_BpuM-BpSp]|nr:putative holliday junction resolvase [Bacillus phage vB_BpuM-BpSp]
MALERGNINKNTKLQNKKVNNLKNSKSYLDIKEDEDYYFVEFNIEGTIEPYQRNRSRNISNKEGQIVASHMYDPLNIYKKNFKKILKNEIDNYENFKPAEGEIELFIDIYLDPPKTSFSNKQKVYAIIKKILKPLAKPDLDNTAKTIMDSFNEIFWKDDNQVIDLRIKKQFSIKRETKIKIKMKKERTVITGRMNSEETEMWEKIKVQL